MNTYKHHRFRPASTAHSLAPLLKYSSHTESKSAWLIAYHGILQLIQGRAYKDPLKNSVADSFTDMAFMEDAGGG